MKLSAKSFYRVSFLVFECFSIEYKHRESEDKSYIKEGMNNINRKEWRTQQYGGSNNRLDIEGFKIRKNYHQKLAEIEERLIPGPYCHIGHGSDGMADDIDPNDEKDGKEWRDEGREKEDDGEEKKKLYVDKANWREKKERKGGFCDQKYHRRYNGLYKNNYEQDSWEAKKFTENEVSSSHGFREDQIDGFSFNFPEEQLTSDKNHRNNPKHFHHSESEISHDFIGLSER